MGLFLALSGVIGKTHNEVVNSLTNYARAMNGNLHPEKDLDTYTSCIIEEAYGNTSIQYPDDFLEWDASSAFLSKDLNAPVFSFHIHDGDLWMYILFYNGEIVDQFNPVPDYWEGEVTEEEFESWKGNANTVTKYVTYTKPSDIDNYLVRWEHNREENIKAYPGDRHFRGDWQLLDFMKTLKLPYPVDDHGAPKGHTYKLWIR
jgi:hypothetical protein